MLNLEPAPGLPTSLPASVLAKAPRARSRDSRSSSLGRASPEPHAPSSLNDPRPKRARRAPRWLTEVTAHIASASEEEADEDSQEEDEPEPASPAEEAEALPLLHLGAARSSALFISKNRALDESRHENVFVVSETDSPVLAAVGIDVEEAGELRYTSTPQFVRTPLVTCATRQQLMDWLRDMGAVEDLGCDDGEAAEVLAQTPLHVIQTRPRWSGWRECHGGGEGCITFYLQQPGGGEETAAVEGREGPGGGFTVLEMVGSLDVGDSLPGRAEVLAFLGRCMREPCSPRAPASLAAPPAEEAAAAEEEPELRLLPSWLGEAPPEAEAPALIQGRTGSLSSFAAMAL